HHPSAAARRGRAAVARTTGRGRNVPRPCVAASPPHDGRPRLPSRSGQARPRGQHDHGRGRDLARRALPHPPAPPAPPDGPAPPTLPGPAAGAGHSREEPGPASRFLLPLPRGRAVPGCAAVVPTALRNELPVPGPAARAAVQRHTENGAVRRVAAVPAPPARAHPPPVAAPPDAGRRPAHAPAPHCRTNLRP